MPSLNRRSMLLVALALCLAVGCSKEEGPAPAGKEGAESRAAAQAKPNRDKADGAVLALIDGLQNDHPEAFWEFLPASYQDDLNKLVHSFAEKMDPELWRKTADVLRKLVVVLKTKKEFLDGVGAGGKRAPDANRQPTDWASLAEMLDALLKSDLADLDRLKKADAGKILAGPGGKILGQLRAFSNLMPDDSFAKNLRGLKDLRVTLVSSSGESAKVKFSAPNEEPKEFDFIRVEGKWIPLNLANEWIENMGEANARLVMLSPETFADEKPQYLAVLSNIGDKLDKLAAAKTQADFNMGVQEGVFALIPVIMALNGAPPPETDDASPPGNGTPEDAPPPTKEELATVVVKARLTEEEQDTLSRKLNAVTDVRGRWSGEITSDDESSFFKVGPVADIEAYAARIDFLTVTSIDTKNRVIIAVPKKK